MYIIGMEEIWKDIKGYEGLYQVSNMGNVRSLNYNKTKTIKELTKHLSGKGYYQVCLQYGKKSKYPLVHRLVAEAFIPNQYNLLQVNHKDENKTNNFVWVNPDGSVDLEKSNLEWCSNEYNLSYGSRISRISNANKTKIYVYEENEIVCIFDSLKLASKFFGFPRTCISRALSTNAEYKGFIWKYEKDAV